MSVSQTSVSMPTPAAIACTRRCSSGNQRVALILREVVGLSAREAAESLETSQASVNSALQRPRQTVDEKLPDTSILDDTYVGRA